MKIDGVILNQDRITLEILFLILENYLSTITNKEKEVNNFFSIHHI